MYEEGIALNTYSWSASMDSKSRQNTIGIGFTVHLAVTVQLKVQRIDPCKINFHPPLFG